MSAKPIPDGFHSVSPCLLVKHGAVRLAQLKVGDSFVMLGEPQGDPMLASLYLLCS